MANEDRLRASPGGTAGTGEPDATPDFPGNDRAEGSGGDSPIGRDPKINAGDPALNRGGKRTGEGGEAEPAAAGAGDPGGMGGARAGTESHDRPDGGSSPMGADDVGRN